MFYRRKRKRNYLVMLLGHKHNILSTSMIILSSFIITNKPKAKHFSTCSFSFSDQISYTNQNLKYFTVRGWNHVASIKRIYRGSYRLPGCGWLLWAYFGNSWTRKYLVRHEWAIYATDRRVWLIPHIVLVFLCNDDINIHWLIWEWKDLIWK